jgi:hypothetical protein
MATLVKERINKIVAKQPADSSYDEILRELVFARMIEQGLDDSKNNRTTKHEDLKKEIELW